MYHNFIIHKNHGTSTYARIRSDSSQNSLFDDTSYVLKFQSKSCGDLVAFYNAISKVIVTSRDDDIGYF